MITKYTSGTPIRTDAVVKDFAGIDINKFPVDYKIIDGKFIFSFDMQDSDIVFGLGEAPRGINKRGWIYESFCSDDPFHTETKSSLYAAHNFLMLNGSKTFGIFIDFPAKIRWDIGYTKPSRTEITVDGTDFDIYIIENESNKPIDIVKEFRSAIGQSYIPPFWAFGYQQSRWSYPDKAAVDGVIKGYDDAKIPLDCVYLDIDYMKDYKDFTVDEDKFPNFAEYVKEKKEQGIHLIPIIDAGVKKEAGYDVVLGTWRGLGVPADTPDEVVEQLYQIFSQAAESDAFVDFMNKSNNVIDIMDGPSFEERIVSDLDTYKALVTDLGLKIQ